MIQFFIVDVLDNTRRFNKPCSAACQSSAVCDGVANAADQRKCRPVALNAFSFRRCELSLHRAAPVFSFQFYVSSIAAILGFFFTVCSGKVPRWGTGDIPIAPTPPRQNLGLAPQIFQHMCNKKRSVTFEIHQNVFLAPGPRWGAHDVPQNP